MIKEKNKYKEEIGEEGTIQIGWVPIKKNLHANYFIGSKYILHNNRCQLHLRNNHHHRSRIQQCWLYHRSICRLSSFGKWHMDPLEQ